MVDLLKIVDDRQKNNGDWRASAYLEQKEKDKVDVVYETEYYRRSADQKFMILFTKPKSSAGQGYLRLDKNLWFYDPSVGKWERRTERERIGGTNSRRSDFDESRLAEEYDPTDEGEEKLGAYTAQKLLLKGKAGLDLAFPMIRIWIDKETKNVLKRQEYALSGPAAAHLVLPEVEEGLQRVEEGGRLLPGGDPLLRRGREGEPDAGPDPGGRSAPAPREPVHEGLAREQEQVMRRDRGRARVARSRGPGAAWAQAGGDRPSEQDIFGGSAPKPAAPAPAGARRRRASAAAGARRAAPAPAPPSGGRRPPPRTVPPAAAAEGTERDQSVLGNSGGATQPLSDYIAPDNPLQIGGQIYLRTQTTAFQGSHPPPPSSQWALSAPSLLDVYLDARPNPRVRAFVLGRMSFDPTRAPEQRERHAARASAAARGPSSGRRRRASPPSPPAADRPRCSIRCGSGSTSSSTCS